MLDPQYLVMLVTIVISNGVTIAVLKTDISWIKRTIERHEKLIEELHGV